ncbi:MAG TPA: shikimate kinase [Thermodesulfobacteriota bacterium]
MSALEPDANIVLVGFMGAGKSAVGRSLARRLGRPFVDTDREVERRAGRTIPAIFAAEGEPAFRALEREAIAETAARRGLVVATGGGAPVDPANLAALRASGFVVYLAARPETLLARVGAGEGRPVLAGADDPAVRVRELLERREPAYRQADLIVETDDLAVAAVATRVLRAARARGIR